MESWKYILEDLENQGFYSLSMDLIENLPLAQGNLPHAINPSNVVPLDSMSSSLSSSINDRGDDGGE